MKNTEGADRPITARGKLTLLCGEKFFGPGVCELLEGIRETGSIQASAARMRMSYTKAWRILNQAEAAMGVRLITRVSGGKNGGSSSLTPAGERTVAAFRNMEAKLTHAADALLWDCREVFMPEEGARDDLPG